MAKGKNATRHGERAQAFQVLYGLSFSPAASAAELRRQFRRSPDAAPEAPAEDAATADAPSGFAWELVEGVWREQERLDAAIARHARNWRLDRMGRVELTLLRLAVYEMLFRPDVPPKVAINEALELSREYGADTAKNFINGILDAVAKTLESPSGEAPSPAPSV
ncbi:transcription antitermination factor NusB [Desulfovibrio legallii]|jgi:N utilization substance protein B|uniref:Transcription antitermination protein NusB n=1 Tax=Desulfovibrio legallii TaxID=571438 RepID=A0A1G7NBP8_9BACT|nr:transcription antitermination factor NusB [Desulfovibrio legallii]SDF71386.1 NusB antitermination factor [Desulfovibrio legallii]